jgi:hypothetical protein
MVSSMWSMGIYIRVNIGLRQFTALRTARNMRLNETRLGVLLVLFTFPVQHSQCHSISIVDSTTAFPFLRNVENPSTAMWWDSGTVIQLLSNCKLIRITRRGVRCIESQHDLLQGWEKSFTPAVSCNPISTALCVTRDGNRFFPTDIVFVADTSATKCVQGQGRQLVSEKKTRLTNKTFTYGKDDISLCDILDNNLDVIYDPVNDYIYEKELNKSGGLYIFISLLVLMSVVLTAEALSQRSRSHLTHNIIAWVLLTGASFLMLIESDGRMHPLITIQDKTFIFTSLVYILISTTFWVFSAAVTRQVMQPEVHVSKSDVPKSNTNTDNPTDPILHVPETQRDGINAMIGSIHFATCVLYGTPDNSYVSGFFFVFLFRCMQKIYDSHHNPQQWTIAANTLILVDIVYTTTIFSFGVLPHFTNHIDSILYAAAQYVICDTVASTCATTTKKAVPTSPPSTQPSASMPAAMAASWARPQPVDPTQQPTIADT